MLIQTFIKICAAILVFSAATAIFFSFLTSDVEKKKHTQKEMYSPKKVCITRNFTLVLSFR